MRVKIIRPTFINGEPVEPAALGKDGKPPKGDGCIEVDEKTGRYLITAGKALPADDAAEPVTNRMRGKANGSRTNGRDGAGGDGEGDGGDGDGEGGEGADDDGSGNANDSETK